MSKIEVDAIDKQSGSTLTIGGSGTTVQLGTGASQTGFGRTGTVDWQTTAKTATFTAASGEGYFCNTTSGGFEVDLPAGTPGAIVSVQDYNNTFDTGNLTIDPNGSQKINGGDAGKELTLSTEGQGLTLVYVDDTVGWRSVHSDDFSEVPLNPTYITATGGTITTVDTNFKVHTFTGPGTFTVCSTGNPVGSDTVSYMVIGGGGGGGRGTGPSDRAGGGGAGGFRESRAASDSYTASPLNATSGPFYNLPVTAQGYPITIGAGGATVGSGGTCGNNGTNSTFSTIIATAGGGGGANSTVGKAGGSGGGGGGGNSAGVSGGAGNTPPVSPPQGQSGGTGGLGSPNIGGGGGGGATVAGSDASGGGGNGGTGATTSINGTPTERAGGGGGDKCASASGGGSATACTAATANTGGGGVGGYPGGGGGDGMQGGSGIVIIRYKFQN